MKCGYNCSYFELYKQYAWAGTGQNLSKTFCDNAAHLLILFIRVAVAHHIYTCIHIYTIE